MELFRKKFWYSTVAIRLLPVAVVGIVLLATCRKDAPVPVEDGCYSFGTSSSPFGFQYAYPRYLYREPCFNPQNSDEFVYVREDKQNNSATQMRRHVISNHIDDSLVADVWGVPDWHANGWILFRRTDNQIWKIKANGDSLTQLTFTGINLGPRWNTAGDRIAYASDNWTIIASAQGLPIDTITDFQMLYGDWSADGTKLCSVVSAGTGEGIGYYDLTTSQTTVVATVPTGELVIESYWKRDSRTIYWATRNGFYKTDIVTMATVLIRPSCDSKFWWAFQFSGDGQKMIWERANSRLTGSDHNTIYQENFIYLLNTDGTGEQKIDIQ